MNSSSVVPGQRNANLMVRCGNETWKKAETGDMSPAPPGFDYPERNFELFK